MKNLLNRAWILCLAMAALTFVISCNDEETESKDPKASFTTDMGWLKGDFY